MSTLPNGPWEIPLRDFIKTLPIVVKVFNIKQDRLEQEIHLDYGNKDDRTYLGKLSFWAYSNGRSVECLSKKDWEQEPK